LDVCRVEIQPQIGAAVEERPERDRAHCPGQRRAEAVVDSVSERKVTCGFAAQVELIRVGEALPRGEPRDADLDGPS
jgi:hypothetical protein